MQEHRTALGAAAVSFYIVLSLAPLLLVAVAAAGFVLGSSEQAMRIVDRYLVQMLPAAGGTIKSQVREIIEGRVTAGVVGVALWLWGGSAMFMAIQKMMNEIWSVERGRGWFRGRALALAMIPLIGIVALLSLSASAAARIVREVLTRLPLGYITGSPTLWSAIALALAVVTSVALFWLICVILPNRRVDWAAALVGAGLAGVLWEVSKQAFGWYVRHSTSFAAYGPLAGGVLVLLWGYYSSFILLLGAEVGALLERRRRQGRDSGPGAWGSAVARGQQPETT